MYIHLYLFVCLGAFKRRISPELPLPSSQSGTTRTCVYLYLHIYIYTYKSSYLFVRSGAFE